MLDKAYTLDQVTSFGFTLLTAESQLLVFELHNPSGHILGARYGKIEKLH